MNYGYYTSGNTVELADGDAVDTFTTLVNYTSVSDVVEMLQSLGVTTDKLRGIVCAHALAEVGLD